MARVTIASLAKTLGCAAMLFAATAASEAAALPEGTGRSTVEGLCLACHGTRQILRSSGYDRAGWRELIGTMVDLSDQPEDERAVVGYLMAHFPPNERRRPQLIDGPVEIAFEEWTVPSLGQRARDPVEAPDGTIWWAGQWGNLIGRIDPGSDAMTEYPLPAGAKPHSVTVGPAGKVWYTGNKNGTMGALDPASGEITEWPSPSGPDSHPYAIAVVAGKVWYNESGKRPDALVRFDPETESFQSWAVPSGGVFAGIIRHMRPDRAGDLLIHQSSTNRITRVRLKPSSATQ